MDYIRTGSDGQLSFALSTDFYLFLTSKYIHNNTEIIKRKIKRGVIT